MISHAFITHGLTVALMVCMMLVIISDAVHYIIPNWLNSLVALLFFVGVATLHLPLVSGLMAAGMLLALGLGFFALGLMGGGDIKLLVVCALWTGFTKATLDFIFLTALMGGGLVMVTLLLRIMIPPLWLRFAPNRNMPRLLTRGEAVPYGIAIAGAFLWILHQGVIQL